MHHEVRGLTVCVVDVADERNEHPMLKPVWDGLPRLNLPVMAVPSSWSAKGGFLWATG